MTLGYSGSLTAAIKDVFSAMSPRSASTSARHGGQQDRLLLCEEAEDKIDTNTEPVDT